MKITVEAMSHDFWSTGALQPAGTWRAHVIVPRELLDAPNVMGSATNEPWICGTGSSADAAMVSLYTAIGRAYLHAK